MSAATPLQALTDRLKRANEALLALQTGENPERDRHLESKREGVLLAMSYAYEMERRDA